MRILGTPVELRSYPATGVVNRRFERFSLPQLDSVFLPESLAGLIDDPPTGARRFVEDDNRGAVSVEPVASLDGRPFYLSVKGIGSTIDPYSARPLDGASAAELTEDPELRERLRRAPPSEPGRMITGELWLRGSPYGGQGWEHARTALAVSERADLTSIAGFQIAPVVRVSRLPGPLEERVRRLYWYRQYPGRIVQELRLVPSNVRIYFHARQTLGSSAREVFDLFSLDRPADVLSFELRFVRSAVATLTLFARTLTLDRPSGRFCGLDFEDVWLDKDAVLAPDGTIFFVDLEGLEEVRVEEAAVREKLEDQVYRSLYEFMFGFEQIEQERARRFGERPDRRAHFERVLAEAVKEDPFVRLAPAGGGLDLIVRNALERENLYLAFRIVDR